ncbi:MAG: nitrite/sulfite reductase, partial [Phaeodactylibacter sp.]|nr:nitrite/sulfite reductase [Phaeodactylibacter sp.]
MKSFRTEIEDPIVEQDIIELERKIALFKHGKIDEERFRSLRLARGVYGQRQPGVQMVRIKVPFGKLNARKLRRICAVADEYSTGRLHITTRQDIQIHYVALDRTPQLWAELEKDQVTLREACGNTVRNVTASATSGIDPAEPFDPRPYADALFRYFLRNPICQEMGRKFKIAFSNTSADTGLAFMHDLGFIAKTEVINGLPTHGFQVWVGGGLGSQSLHAFQQSDFLPADQLIPFTEAVLRVFERYGERNRRMKARLKFLIKDWGFEPFMEKVEEERQVLPEHFPIVYQETLVRLPSYSNGHPPTETDAYKLWKNTNVLPQKNGLFAIGLKVRLGDIYTKEALQIADWAEQFSGDELTLTIDQNLLIRHIPEDLLPVWYEKLHSIGLADIGFNTFNDITACPGTDT